MLGILLSANWLLHSMVCGEQRPVLNGNEYGLLHANFITAQTEFILQSTIHLILISQLQFAYSTTKVQQAYYDYMYLSTWPCSIFPTMSLWSLNGLDNNHYNSITTIILMIGTHNENSSITQKILEWMCKINKIWNYEINFNGIIGFKVSGTSFVAARMNNHLYVHCIQKNTRFIFLHSVWKFTTLNENLTQCRQFNVHIVKYFFPHIMLCLCWLSNNR